MQVGMGGGMKAGINVWLALRNNSTVHKAWRHLAAQPLTEADLPRPIQPTAAQSQAKSTSSQAPELGEPHRETTMAGAAPSAAAAAAGEELAKPVARKLTVEVKAFTESNELSDDQLADLAH